MAVPANPRVRGLEPRFTRRGGDDPPWIGRRHGHHSPHTLTVLEGSMTCDGVEQMPDPPIELPGNLEDLRAVFAGPKADG